MRSFSVSRLKFCVRTSTTALILSTLSVALQRQTYHPDKLGTVVGWKAFMTLTAITAATDKSIMNHDLIIQCINRQSCTQQ